MDYIEPICCIAEKIYSLAQEVKANKERCRRVAKRVKALEQLVRSAKDKGISQNSTDVETGLSELKITLESAVAVIQKYTSASFFKRIVKTYNHSDEFASLNERLNDAFQVLSLALGVHQGDTINKVFEITSRHAEDEEDRQRDRLDLEKVLCERAAALEDTAKDLKKDMETLIEKISKPKMTRQDIREIQPHELDYGFPKHLLMTTSTSEVYKGAYNKFPVAIKRYTYPMTMCPSEVRKIFHKEIETMRRFESPNILRMFGICVQDENGPNPNYVIVMEYCAKGSLREVLGSDCRLPWSRKARMSLDAAQGLYRLHQTEEKSKIHCSINSSKFLVDEGYRVKLGGLELAKTESSLRKVTDQKQSDFCYSSPQEMESIHYRYDKGCEMYSFGIVLWEIATRKMPFADCSTSMEVHQKVCVNKILEPLPDDCPAKLAKLINGCRAYATFERPTAGVLVDELRKIVEQIEEE